MTITYPLRSGDQTLTAIALNPGDPGVPVILLHGITASVHFWEPGLVAPFREYGPCYALSLPGHYPAAFPPSFGPDDLTAESIAAVLTAAIRELVGECPVLLVGHSTGGFAALAIAAHTPEIARGVISIAGFAQGQWTGALGMYQHWARSGALGRLAFKSVYGAAKVSYAIFHQASRMYTPNPKRVFAYPGLAAIVKPLSFPAYRKLNLDAMLLYFRRMPDIDITPLLPRITAPTLALTGDADPIVPPAQARLIAERVPQAALAVLEGGVGHVPFYEAPEAYGQAISGWLRVYGATH